VHLEAANDEMVKFISNSGKHVAWIPTYGKGGYIELIRRVLEDFSLDREITVRMATVFETRFANFQVPPPDGGVWKFDFGPRCVNCGSSNLIEVAETIEESPPLNWLSYKFPGG
jgi:hypothetical protein